MKLSDLKTGERGVIVKVQGHGGFRKRIVEMGFIKGKEVEVLLNAPLKDPVKYKIMGYEVSLRHNEASMIEIVDVSEEAKLKSEMNADERGNYSLSEDAANCSEDHLHNPHSSLQSDFKKINVALVGNPNCGKTSLFNFASGAHERVGNYSGVTVDAKEGVAHFEGYEFHLVDLPGTYSLSAYSPEELYVRKQLVEKTPDVIINVLDSSNLERNLYLTTQLVDMHLRMVCALNMFDEFENRGDHLDYKKLGQLFGVPMVPTVFRTGRGVEQLFHTIIELYEGDEVADDKSAKANAFRHVHLNHGQILEQSIDAVKLEIQKTDQIRYKYSTRYLAIKLLEMDLETEKVIRSLPNGSDIFKTRDAEAKRIKSEMQEDSETAIMDAKYGIVHGALEEAEYSPGQERSTYHITHHIDSVITNRYLGFPIFILLIFLMFEVTFTLGQYPMDWIEMGVEWLGETISSTLADGPLKAMLVDGVIGGVGSVIVFLPQILILYSFISFMEDSGYMARAAFIMDKLMHKMGLHGKSFIPLIMGFGCNVPAVMATRTIESRRSRLITMLVLPMMSCSARLPIYIMVTGIFFPIEYQGLIMISLYLVGIVMSVIVSRVLSRWVVKGDDTPFVMELPPYRFPTGKAIFRHTWEKGKQYLHKMGGIILVASIVVWALGYFPHDESLDEQAQQEQSYIGQIGKAIEPIFEAQGFDWKLDVGLVAGVGAKEIVASTIGVLYGDTKLMAAEGITPLIAYCYLLFVLIYFPCIATIAAIKNESGSWKWAAFAAIYTTALAWVVSALVYRIGLVFFS